MKISLSIKTEKLENGKIRITSPLGQTLEMTEAEYSYFTYKAKQDKKRAKRANQAY